MDIEDFGPAVYGPDGLLARNLPGFEPRPQQQQMAEFVYAALRASGKVIGTQPCRECYQFRDLGMNPDCENCGGVGREPSVQARIRLSSRPHSNRAKVELSGGMSDVRIAPKAGGAGKRPYRRASKTAGKRPTIVVGAVVC